MTRNNRTLWTIVAIIVVALIALVVFLVVRGSPSTTGTNTSATSTATSALTTNTPTTSTATSESSRTFNLTAQNGSGQNGTVLLEQVGVQVRVTITLSNPSATPEPAHIHTGSCPTPGAVVYPLENVVNGTSTTMLSTTLVNLASQIPLAVNVHKSASESNVYYACGNLSF